MKKELPDPQVETDALFTLPYEALKWELLKTAIELNLFDQLVTPATSEHIAGKLSLDAANTEYVLNALVALRCLTKVDNKFSNAPQAEQFLTTGRDTSIGESLLFMEGWMLPLFNGGLKKMVKEGASPQENMAAPALWEKAARVSVNHSRCGRAQKLARNVARLPEFSSFEKVLDIGAGPGIFGVAVAAVHPTVQCVVMDHAEVCKVADEIIQEYGMEGRVSAKAGDYMQDDIGKDYDFVMANFTLNFYRDRLNDIMRKVYDALKPGGVFMVTSDGLYEDGTGPAGTVISWLSTSIQGNDMSFKTGQIARAMRDVGFVSTEQKTLTDIDLEAHGPVEMTIGRKGQ
jgi:ubiquinone/menaquinone biosynthesis C-methylase UbiE